MEVVKLLIEKGADVNVYMKYGFTPLLLAAKDGKLSKQIRIQSDRMSICDILTSID